MNKKSVTLFLILIFFGGIITSCRKDILSPTPNTNLLFGQWKWIYSKSEFGGISQTPTSVGYERELEYTKKGVYKEFIDGKKEEKLLFTFIEGVSVDFQKPDYVIKYFKSGLNKKEKYIDNFSFPQGDTLILKRDCEGCFSHYFVRQ